MIKSRPIKRNRALVQFSRDHHFGLLLVWKIRQGLRFNATPQRISDYINFFCTDYLQQHFKDEEEMLFIHLSPDDDLRLSAEKDHKLLCDLNKKIKLEPSLTSIREFADKLEQHIRFEEKFLFNHLQACIGQEQLDMIEQKMSASHHSKEDGWKDIFWVKPQYSSIK